MPQINCCIPLKLRLVGELNDTHFEQLEATLARTLTARISLAQRTIVPRHADPIPGEEMVREAYAPARDDAATSGYLIPSYDRGNQRSVPLRGARRKRRYWRVRQAITIYIRLKNFIEFLERIDEFSPAAIKLKALYPEILDDIRPAGVWLVEARRQIPLDFLLEEIREHINNNQRRFGVHSRSWFFGYTTSEQERKILASLEETDRLGQLPDMSMNRVGTIARVPSEFAWLFGRPFLDVGGKLLFIRMALPVIRMEETLDMGREVQVSLRMRDLDFIISPSSFEDGYGVSWDAYIQEFADEPVSLRLLPVYPRRRVHFETLSFMLQGYIRDRLEQGERYAGGLRLLNQTTLNWLPQGPARSAAAELTDEVTRHVSAAEEQDYWSVDWVGAFIYVRLRLSEKNINAARYRPEARRQATRLIPLIRERMWRMHEWLPFEQFLGQYSGRPLAFEYLLEELLRRNESGRWFNLLFERIEQRESEELLRSIILLTPGTRYADHPRIQQSIALLNRRRREDLAHRYVITDAVQEIWLEKRSDARVRAGASGDRDVVGEVWSRYTHEQEEPRFKPGRKDKFDRLLRREAQMLIAEILRGEDQNTYSQEEFARAALERTVQRIGRGTFQEEYIEEVTVAYSVRVVRVSRVNDVAERYEISCELMERIADGRWRPISSPVTLAGSYNPYRFTPNDFLTLSDRDFEDMLAWWPRLRGFAGMQTLAKIVMVGAVLVIAWEVGAIAFLVQLGGGPVVVGISITVSELIYFFTTDNLSLEGFLLAALDGYLFAVGFRFAGMAGRGLAARIGTQSTPRIVAGWITERLAVGTLGGASSAALQTFSHDLINILLGRGGWSSPEAYIRSMGKGVALGIVFEFGIGALQPILRVGGRTALETVEQVVQRIRARGMSLSRWSALTAEALGNLRQRLESFLEPGLAGRVTNAFRQHIAEISEQLSAQGRRRIWRGAVARRTLELSEINLTRSASEGLEKLLRTSVRHLDEQAAVQFFNHLKRNPTQAIRFLEGLNILDDTILEQLTRTRHLEHLVDAPEVIGAIGHDPVISSMIQQAASLSSEQAMRRVRGIVEVIRSRPTVPEVITEGAFFARGGTSEVFEVAGRPDLLVKRGGGRLPREAEALIELETLGIPTVYAATRQTGGSRIVLRRIEGVGSKDIIGRTRRPLNPPQHAEVVTQRTIDDLERIYQTLKENRANVGDFQFIVRRSDGAVFVNDPISLTIGRGPSGNIRNIIDRFKNILRRRQEGGGE